MGFVGGDIGYQLLKRLSPMGGTAGPSGGVGDYTSRIATLFGPRIWDELVGKVVVDFGCGTGADAVEMAKRGAKQVIGVDIRESVLREAREHAERAGVSARCVFTTQPSVRADVVISIDAFEHFADPASVLDVMRTLLRDDGCVLISFGPAWYHPLGGHLFSVFPWAHLVFTERALIRWRSDFKTDGATRFHEVEGGLNRMTIRRFEQLVKQSPFRLISLEAVPIRALRPLANRVTREFTTAVVQCKLVPRAAYETPLGIGIGEA